MKSADYSLTGIPWYTLLLIQLSLIAALVVVIPLGVIAVFQDNFTAQSPGKQTLRAEQLRPRRLRLPVLQRLLDRLSAA
jgi:hypothetical protein